MKFLSKTKVFAYIFYVLAIIFLLYTIFQTVTTITYLSSVASSGMYMDVGFSDMLSAFMGSVGPNVFYTLSFFFFGYVIQLIAGDIIPEDSEFEEKLTEPKASEITPSLTQEPIGEETLELNEYSPEVTTDSTPEDIIVSTSEPDTVEDFMSTMDDVETYSEPETVEITPSDDSNKEIEELEEKIGEFIDESEAENEVNQLELEDEEEKE